MSDVTPAKPVLYDPPWNRAGHNLLLGPYIARDLSRLLILIIIILSPLTFSNNNIPNFKPDCETHYTKSAKSIRKVVVARAVIHKDVATHHELAVSSPQTPFFLPHATPICSSQTSRASPA